MASESREIKAKVGTRLTDAEVKALDPKEIGRMHAQPKDKEVEAQLFRAAQVCPCCGCVGWGWESAYALRYFTCHCCGCTFRA